MTTQPAAPAFEVQGCRALARVGGRLTLVYGVAVVLGVLAGAGARGIATAAQVLGLLGLASPAVVWAGLLLPGGRGRHVADPGADVVPWLPGSPRLRRAAPFVLMAVAVTCGFGVLHRICALAPELGWPHVHQLAGWVIPGFGMGLALAAGPLWGLATFAGLVAGLRLLLGADAAAALPATAAGAAVAVAIGAVVHLAARGGFRATELAARAAEDAELARRDAELHLLRRRRTDRLLHDTVLATLTLLAHAGVGVPPAEVRAACRRDLALLGGDGPDALLTGPDALLTGSDGPDPDGAPASPAAGVAGAVAGGRPQSGLPAPSRTAAAGRLARGLGEVRRLAARRGIDLRVHLQSGSTVEALTESGGDSALLQAWSGALTECVTNIARHADVDAADVVLGLTDDALVTVVVDEGVGFEPADVVAGSLGLAGSVRERLVEVGGDARVWSRPGEGTVVELLVPWPRRPGAPGVRR